VIWLIGHVTAYYWLVAVKIELEVQALWNYFGLYIYDIDLMGIEITKTIAYIAAVGSECDILTSINAM